MTTRPDQSSNPPHPQSATPATPRNDAASSTTGATAAEATLRAEAEHLAGARAALARMRERTLALDISAAGNAVSEAYLASAVYHRAKALEDDAEVPLFFGRVDVVEPPYEGRWYVGRRHVHDDHGDPVVVDWRADVSRAFYRASRAEPLGVALRRRYGFDRGRLTAYEDEHLLDRGEADTRSRILAAEIERPRTGPMRDIVATIQPEQDAVVRTDLDTSVCVQGAPGTGKTAVGLHRVAWLLYAHRDRLRRAGVLVLGPNDAFLDYIGQVLPALGEIDVRQGTVETLVAGRVTVRAVDPPDVGTLKGDARMAEVLRRAVWGSLREPTEPLVAVRGSRRWRVPASVVAESMAALTAREQRYSAGRASLRQRLAHEVLVQLEAEGETTDDRVQDAVARTPVMKKYVDAVWPALDPVGVVHRLLADPQALEAAAAGVLSDVEQASMLRTGRVRGPGTAPWTLADAVLVDEAADLLERTPSLGHVVLDEAQDLSPMQLRAVARRCSTGSMTVLGDIAQGTTPWATTDWGTALRHLGQPDALVEVLDRGYRVPGAVLAFAARLLPRIAPDLSPPQSVREEPGELVRITAADRDAAVAEAVVRATALLDRPGSVGLIAADAAITAVTGRLDASGTRYALLGAGSLADARLTVVPATLAKGLEFDWVVVLEPAELVAAEPRGLRRLYVVLTRAVSGLTVVHAQPLPPELLAG